MNQIHIISVSLSQEEKSPYWVAQWAMSNGKRVKKSTKVPVAAKKGEKPDNVPGVDVMDALEERLMEAEQA